MPQLVIQVRLYFFVCEPSGYLFNYRELCGPSLWNRKAPASWSPVDLWWHGEGVAIVSEHQNVIRVGGNCCQDMNGVTNKKILCFFSFLFLSSPLLSLSSFLLLLRSSSLLPSMERLSLSLGLSESYLREVTQVNTQVSQLFDKVIEYVGQQVSKESILAINYGENYA